MGVHFLSKKDVVRALQLLLAGLDLGQAFVPKIQSTSLKPEKVE